ncbi:MAG: PspC domain-containing protein [Tidjanibacter sp.]|nr:PspC domain-containing protein [Tidjanibacter sp.]
MNEPKKLFRSRHNRMLAGVCGGLAEYFNIDPTLMRVITIVLAFTPFVPVIIIYLLLWLLIPERGINQ